MKGLEMKRLLLSIAATLAGFLCNPLPAAAADPVRFGLCYDLTKAYSFITPQFAQAVRDNAELINSKGGLEGHPIEVIVRDHGNEPQRGIECYERLKGEGVMVFDMLSTPVSRAVIPRIMKDGNILIQAYGRGDAVDGNVFKWVFPLGPTWWGQAANKIAYIKQKSDGKLKGVKIAFFHIDTPFGREPIQVLKVLAEKEGFELSLVPFPVPGSDQASAWTQIRRLNPDWILGWSFSTMNVIAAREMKRNGIPVEKFIAVNAFNEVDISNIGADAAKGMKRSTTVNSGTNIPTSIQNLIKELYDRNKGSGDRKNTNDAYYSHGFALSSAVFEGMRLAIKKDGWPLTPEKIKAGLEGLKNFDANGMMAPITLTAQDHGGGGKTRIEMWDGGKWVPQTGWISAYDDEIWKTVRESSAEFAKSENQK